LESEREVGVAGGADVLDEDSTRKGGWSASDISAVEEAARER
jgi:hypothetical protein